MILQGKRILVVEDEPIIAFALEDMLIDDGADVIAVGSLKDGLANARDERFDFAILDINLHGEKSYPIAHELGRKGVKFVFASGYGDAEHPSELAHVTTLTKPYVLAEIRDMAVAG
ncbi:response regulator [Qipengyuania flava]|uniref:response regulator n=1 Tax=Qipengyuania flava TaxID=192812 RepID=UPI00273EBB79|nr:response regulator [Qipengyuania flava]